MYNKYTPKSLYTVNNEKYYTLVVSEKIPLTFRSVFGFRIQKTPAVVCLQFMVRYIIVTVNKFQRDNIGRRYKCLPTEFNLRDYSEETLIYRSE